MGKVHRTILVGALVMAAVVENDVTSDDVLPLEPIALQHGDASVESIVFEQVDRLASSSRAERQQAEQVLRDLGTAALPFLPETEVIASPHTREVIARLRLELDQLVAAESLQPTLVRIPEDATLGEWVLAIEEQTRYSLAMPDESWSPVHVFSDDTISPTEPTTFWRSVDDVEDNVAVQLERTTDGGLVLEAIAADSEVWYHDSRGVVRASTTALHEIENLIDPEENVRLRTRLRLDVEPKLTGLFVHWNPGDMQAAVGDVSLSAVGADGRRELPIPGSQRIEFPIDFSIPKVGWDQRNANETTLTITGTVSVTVATSFRTFEFRHLDEPGVVVRRRGGLAATLESFESSRDQTGATVWAATLVIDYEGQPLELDSYQLWVFSNAVSLQREDGTTLLPAGERHVSPAEGGAVRMSFIFADALNDLDSATLIYEAPTAIVDVPVEFEVRRTD